MRDKRTSKKKSHRRAVSISLIFRTSVGRSDMSSMFSQPMTSLKFDGERSLAYRGVTLRTSCELRLIVLQITPPQPCTRLHPLHKSTSPKARMDSSAARHTAVCTQQGSPRRMHAASQPRSCREGRSRSQTGWETAVHLLPRRGWGAPPPIREGQE